MTVPFSVVRVHVDGYTLVVVAGEVDLVTAPEMERVLSEAIAYGITDVVVDMAQCEFIDSSGMRVLLKASHKARSLILRSPKTAVRRVAEALGLADVLLIEDAEDAEDEKASTADHRLEQSKTAHTTLP